MISAHHESRTSSGRRANGDAGFGTKPQARMNAAGPRAGRQLCVVALSWAAVLSADVGGPARSEGLKATIVGLGATTCRRFEDDVRTSPAVRRDYLAWAQGFMSGIISSRPPGVDEGLDLAPVSFDLIKQLQFLEDYCARNVSLDFSDAVAALYKRLREEGKT
ncbi:hypothetical protein [Bradyrhizobium sp.]|jgi:hypothetical protein